MGGVTRTVALAAISAALVAAETATRTTSVQRSRLSDTGHRLEHPLTASGTIFWSPLIMESLAFAAAVVPSGARSYALW